MKNKLNIGNFFTSTELAKQCIIVEENALDARFLSSRRPKNIRRKKFGVVIHKLIRQMQSKNKTYKKAKICVILRHVGRIKKKLVFVRSRSTLRRKKNHANVFLGL